MGYEPTNWKDGDLVTSMKLNKIEQGVASSGSGVLMIHANEGVLDKTWKEIQEAMQEKIVCICESNQEQTSHMFIFWSSYNSSTYTVVAFVIAPDGIEDASFITDSEDGYPAIMRPGNGGLGPAVVV